MPNQLITAAAQAAHQIGAVILVGGLFFLLFIVRPVSKQTLGVEDRQRLFQRVYQHTLRWQWLALLLLWTGGVGQILSLKMTELSVSIQAMAAGGALITLLTFVIQVICYFHLNERMEEAHWGRAARISSLVRKIMAVNLLICVLLVVAAFGEPILHPLLAKA
jgi:uncharacterized membrane protein